jgi:hypothetical protein
LALKYQTVAATLLALTIGAQPSVGTERREQTTPVEGRVAASSSQDEASVRHELLCPINHEVWLYRIDAAGVAVREAKGSVLIAIARLGKGERDRRLNRLRLKYVAEIIQGRQFPIRLVTAEGDSVSELGRVEFYVNNELFTVLPYERGKAVAIQHQP